MPVKQRLQLEYDMTWPEGEMAGCSTSSRVMGSMKPGNGLSFLAPSGCSSASSVPVRDKYEDETKKKKKKKKSRRDKKKKMRK